MRTNQALKEAKRLSQLGVRVIAQRNDAIRAARDAGHSLREIAAATGISHQTIKRLTEKSTP